MDQDGTLAIKVTLTWISSLRTGEKEVVYNNNGDLCTGERENAILCDKPGRKIRYKINCHLSQIKKPSESGQLAAKKAKHEKPSAYAKVEHIFSVVKSNHSHFERNESGLFLFA